MAREGSGGTPRGPGGVGRYTQRCRRSQEAHQKVQEGSGVPPVGPGGVGRPTRRFWMRQEAHTEV